MKYCCRKCQYLLVSIVFVFSILNVKAADFFAGAEKIDITPPLELKSSLGGYGARLSKPAKGVHDRIWAKAVVFQQQEKKFALVTCDVLGIPPNVKPAVVEKLGDGWSIKNVMILPSHTHASMDLTALNDKNVLNNPQLGIFQPKVLELLVDKLANSILEAEKNLRPAKIGTAVMQVDGKNRNRRGGEFIDRELTVTKIVEKNNKSIAVLINWTAHPTLMDENDMLFSGGWPGYLQRELEQKIGDDVIALYYNGAEGDISPVRPQGGSHYEQAEIYGRSIALSAIGLFNSIGPKPVNRFDYGYHVIDLPERVAHPQFKQTGGAEYGITDEVMQILLNVMCPEKTHSTALLLNDLLIAGVPGELTAELGLFIKKQLKQAGVKHPVIGGFANEWISYILSAEEYEKGGYEASVSFYGPGLGESIVEGVLQTALSLVN
jgi:neutral ceramidase